MVGSPRVAHADKNPSFLLEAAKAWEAAELNKAAKLYEQALEEGSLFPSDVLVAYARIGTVRAAKGEKNAALSAFRVAAALDPSFELPSEAGPRATRIYKRAKKDASRQGGKLEIRAKVPAESASGIEFLVVAHLDEAFAPLVADVGITVQDPAISTSTVKPWRSKSPADTKVQFKVPGEVVTAGANLLVRVDALDGYGNRWASTQARVRVKGRTSRLGNNPDDPFFQNREGEKEGKQKSNKGFWKSPWPWVIGGALIVGATTTYFMVRPKENVTVRAPTWQ